MKNNNYAIIGNSLWQFDTEQDFNSEANVKNLYLRNVKYDVDLSMKHFTKKENSSLFYGVEGLENIIFETVSCLTDTEPCSCGYDESDTYIEYLNKIINLSNYDLCSSCAYRDGKTCCIHNIEIQELYDMNDIPDFDCYHYINNVDFRKQELYQDDDFFEDELFNIEEFDSDIEKVPDNEEDFDYYK